MATNTRQLRCSEPAVALAAEFTRWAFRRVKFTARPASPLTGARALLTVLLAAPVRSVELTATPSGDRIRDYLLARQFGLRSRVYAQSILSIPPVGGPALNGRRFRAARTNISRALREGLTCRDLPEPERPPVLRELNQPDWLLEATVQRWWVAETPNRSAAGLALATVDETWALLEILVAPRSAPARYLLHAHLVSSLQASGIRYLLVVGTPLVLPSGLLYLQARLGYEIANLQLARTKHPGSPPAT